MPGTLVMAGTPITSPPPSAKLVTIASDGRGAPDSTAGNIVSVIQTVLAAQLVGKAGLMETPAALPAVPATTAAPAAPATGDGSRRR